jgi:hypothetical protein
MVSHVANLLSARSCSTKLVALRVGALDVPAKFTNVERVGRLVGSLPHAREAHNTAFFLPGR